MFVGRKKYLDKLQKLFKQNRAQVLIYGKRRIGKSELIREACKKVDKTVIYFECLKDTLSINVEAFIKELMRLGVINYQIHFDRFDDLFAFLDTLNLSLIVVIDEYPYLKEYNNTDAIDSMFQKIIDQYLKHIVLVVSGSHMSMMKNLLQEKNALYSRFDYVINLNELDYREASEFYPELSPYEKVAFYSVFGGSPYVNKYLVSSQSLEDNILTLLLDENTAIYQYVDSLLISDLTNTSNAQRILAFLANGRRRYRELEDKLDSQHKGNLSKMLKPLLDMGIVKKIYPINKDNDSKKAFYEISDNILRFYYTYIYQNKSAFNNLPAKVFYDNYVKSSLIIFIAHRFENIAQQYLSLNINHIKAIGTYYYDNPKENSNGQFDVALKIDDYYDLVEVKYHQKPLTQKEINNEIKQIKAIKEIKIKNIGFVSINGFDKSETYPYQIDGNDLYQN